MFTFDLQQVWGQDEVQMEVHRDVTLDLQVALALHKVNCKHKTLDSILAQVDAAKTC